MRSMRKAGVTMRHIQPQEDYRFATISEFKWSMSRGGEVGFFFEEKAYFVHATSSGYNIGECYHLRGEEAFNIGDEQPVGNIHGCDYDTLEKLLNHSFGDVKLREIIRSVEVFDRLT